MSVLIELFVTVAVFFVDASIHLLRLVFSSTWLATHTKGATRISYCVTALTAFHQLAGVLLVFLNAAPALVLSPFYSKTVVILSLAVLLFSITVPLSLTKIGLGTATATVEDDLPESSEGINLLSLLLVIAVSMGILNFSTAQSTRESLKQELCDSVLNKIGDDLVGEGSNALQWLDGLADNDLFKPSSCLDKQLGS